METQKTPLPLKDLPAQPKKGKIYEMYGRQYSIPTMKTNLNALIEEFKKATKMQVNSRDVPRPVWIEWLSTFGFPVGYKQHPEWLEEKTILNQ